ncbi:MAG TPA: DUF294 nucleotidyltransferase-like domain-containing protein, partial [Desulfobacter sp.]|nr:DUF294 nucleotidyltransferase-like domain-containing protein [Desulfobacter sp.]
MKPEAEHPHINLAEQLDKQRKALFESISREDAPRLLKEHARLIDEYLRSSFEASWVGPKMHIAANPYAIIALGGYGRAEECYHSDVDLLILFKKSVPQASEELVREIVYPLWDIRMEVGYTIQSINACVRLARSDYEVMTSLLDARFVCGISSVFGELMENLRKSLLRRMPR